MGQFNTHGGFFSPQGYFKVETGGSHDENPNGGVQIGVDPQGVPNMLEEGEPAYNDYVFSDNIRADAAILKKHNLPTRLAGKLYSEIVDEYMDEAAIRANDPISNNGLRSMLRRAADAQEEQKQIQEERELEKELSQLSPEELDALEAYLSQAQMEGEQAQAEEPVPQEMVQEQGVPMNAGAMNMMQPAPMMANGGFIRRFDMGGNTVPPPYGDTSMLYDPYAEVPQEVVVTSSAPVAEATPADIVAAAEQAGIVSPFKRREKLDPVAQAIIDNEAAKHVGVDLETGMRVEQPLVDEHPGADLALMYAQPGGIVAKAFAPSMARGFIQDIANGDTQSLAFNLLPVGRFGKIARFEKSTRGGVKSADDVLTEAAKKSPLVKEEARIAKAEAKRSFDIAKDEYEQAIDALQAAEKDLKAGRITEDVYEAKRAYLESAGARYNEAKNAKNALSGKRVKTKTGTTGDPAPTGKFKTILKKGWFPTLATGSVAGGLLWGRGRVWGNDGSSGNVWNENGQVDSTVVPGDSVYVEPEYDDSVRSYVDSLMRSYETNQNAKGGRINRYDGLGNSWLSRMNDLGLEYTPVAADDPNKALQDAIARQKAGAGTYPGYIANPFEFNTYTYHNGNSPQYTPVPQPRQRIPSPYYQTFPQYSKVFNAGIWGLHDVATAPDRLSILPYNPILPEARMHLVDPRYTPTDRNSVVNDVLSSGAGVTSAIRGSGYGLATPAAMLAHDYTLGRNVGKAGVVVDDANNKLYNTAIAGRNSNAEMLGKFDYRTAKDRATILNDAIIRRQANDILRQKFNYEGEGQKFAAIQNQSDVVADALAKIARQNFIFNQLNSNTAFDWNTGPTGVATYGWRRLFDDDEEETKKKS